MVWCSSGFLVAWGSLGAESTIGAGFVRGVVGRLKDAEAAHKGVVDRHQGARIVKFTAVVGSAEDCHELAATEEFIAIFDDLMGTANKINIIFLQEALYYCLAKRV